MIMCDNKTDISVIRIYDTVSPETLLINCTSRARDIFKNLSPFLVGKGTPLYGQWTAQSIENAWQYTKVYPSHVDSTGEPTEEYFKWAAAGWGSGRAERYPMGKGAIPLYSYWDGEKLGYIEARRRIYIPLYARAVVRTEAFALLQKLHRQGMEIAIQDFDAYDHKKLGYSTADIISDLSRKMGHGFVLKFLLEGSVVVKEDGSVLLPESKTRGEQPPEFEQLILG